MTTSQALTVFDPAQLPILRQTPDEIADMMEILNENLRGRRITPRDLQKLRIPTGGSTTWDYPVLGGFDARKAVDGVIVGVATPRILWLEKFGEGEKSPPDCTSGDGITGLGLYGRDGERAMDGGRLQIPGDCAACPMNQWPARGAANRRKPCRELRAVFFLPLGEEVILPKVLMATPGSLKNVDDYLLLLSSYGLPFYGVSTRMTLTKVKNAGGLDYSQAVFEVGERLERAEMLKIRNYARKMAPLFGQVEVETEDVRAAA